MDVGCGDGSITNEFVNDNEVTGVDLSPVALEHLDKRVKKVLASADKLPFEDGGFDLVFSSELIEHLDDTGLARTLGEFRRLARKHILISVPNNEKLRKRFARCGACGREFHVYSHLQSFNRGKLQKLLPGWRLVDSRICGHPDTPSLNLVSWLRSRIAGNYFNLPEMICPYCGRGLSLAQLAGIRSAIDFSLRAAQKVVLLMLGKQAEPDWLLVLFSKE